METCFPLTYINTWILINISFTNPGTELCDINISGVTPLLCYINISSVTPLLCDGVYQSWYRKLNISWLGIYINWYNRVMVSHHCKYSIVHTIKVISLSTPSQIFHCPHHHRCLTVHTITIIFCVLRRFWERRLIFESENNCVFFTVIRKLLTVICWFPQHFHHCSFCVAHWWTNVQEIITSDKMLAFLSNYR